MICGNQVALPNKTAELYGGCAVQKPKGINVSILRHPNLEWDAFPENWKNFIVWLDKNSLTQNEKAEIRSKMEKRLARGVNKKSDIDWMPFLHRWNVRYAKEVDGAVRLSFLELAQLAMFCDKRLRDELNAGIETPYIDPEETAKEDKKKDLVATYVESALATIEARRSNTARQPRPKRKAVVRAISGVDEFDVDAILNDIDGSENDRFFDEEDSFLDDGLLGDDEFSFVETTTSRKIRSAFDDTKSTEPGMVKIGRGRPKGSKNKPKPEQLTADPAPKRGRGRPKGSKNKPKPEQLTAYPAPKRGRGRPKGSKNKPKPVPPVGEQPAPKRGRGRPKGSKNKPKSIV